MKRIAILICFSLLLVTLIGCQSSQRRETLTVFAASSLTDAFTEIGEAFEAEHSNVKVVFSFAGSSALAIQLLEGAPADIFASANNAQMQTVIDAGRIDTPPRIFARNRLIVILPTDNPAGIQSLADLAAPEISFITAAPGVPVRNYTDILLEQMALDTAFGPAYRQSVLANIISEEDNVRQVLVKVALGEADVGIVYQSDVTPDMADAITTLPIPDQFSPAVTYPIAAVEDSDHARIATTFIDFVLSHAGQNILMNWGFLPACANDCENSQS